MRPPVVVVVLGHISCAHVFSVLSATPHMARDSIHVGFEIKGNELLPQAACVQWVCLEPLPKCIYIFVYSYIRVYGETQ